MLNILEDKIDTSKASLEELEELRNIFQNIVQQLNHEINGRKIASHKYSSLSSNS